LLRTLKSLHNQVYKLDKIYLGIPNISKRLKKEYPEIPEEIKKYVTIVECEEDYGPCTKIVGGLLSEQDAETMIITFDDDVIYSPTLVSKLIEYHSENKNCAIGSSGILLNTDFHFIVQ